MARGNPHPVPNPNGRPPDRRNLQKPVPIRFGKAQEQFIRDRSEVEQIPFAEVVREIVTQAMEESK